MRILPPKKGLVQLVGSDDFFLWEYYGEGLLGKIQAWIFRSRINGVNRVLEAITAETSDDFGCGVWSNVHKLCFDQRRNKQLHRS